MDFFWLLIIVCLPLRIVVSIPACHVGDWGSIPQRGDWSTTFWASLVAQMIKNPPAMWKTWVGKIPWRRAWQPTLVFLPGESPWTEKSGGIQSIQWQRVDHDQNDFALILLYGKGMLWTYVMVGLHFLWKYIYLYLLHIYIDISHMHVYVYIYIHTQSSLELRI